MYDLIDKLVRNCTADFDKHIADFKAEAEARLAHLNGMNATVDAAMEQAAKEAQTGVEPQADPLGGSDDRDPNADDN